MTPFPALSETFLSGEVLKPTQMLFIWGLSSGAFGTLLFLFQLSSFLSAESVSAGKTGRPKVTQICGRVVNFSHYTGT